MDVMAYCTRGWVVGGGFWCAAYVGVDRLATTRVRTYNNGFRLCVAWHRRLTKSPHTQAHTQAHNHPLIDTDLPSVKESMEEQSTPNMAQTSPAAISSISCNGAWCGVCEVGWFECVGCLFVC